MNWADWMRYLREVARRYVTLRETREEQQLVFREPWKDQILVITTTMELVDTGMVEPADASTHVNMALRDVGAHPEQLEPSQPPGWTPEQGVIRGA